jgi:putative ABC transport system permease protein
MGYRAFAYLIAISLGTGLLFGIAPALRLSKLDVNATWKDGGRGVTGGRRGKPLSALLVTAEMALAIVLLAGAGVMIRSFLNVYTADLGVNTTNILTALLKVPDATYPQASFFARLKTRLEAIPGVESIAIANTIPTAGSLKFPYELAGATQLEEQRRPKLSALLISPAYFRTLGSTVLSGREFNNADGASGIPVVIVNRWFADKYWPQENPLGKRLRLFNGKTPEAWRTVVGVVPNIVQNAATRQESDPLVYLQYREKPAGGMWLFARTRVPPGKLGTTFRRELQASDPDLTIWLGPYSLSERLSWTYWNRRLYGVLLLILAALALLLASVGLYALIAHSVSRRTQEIGIRMAIGATARDIRKLVFMQGMLPLGMGLILGLAGSIAVNRVLKAVLVQVSPADPITLIASSATLILAAMLGCFIPARRAMRIDPVIALRHD